jgi:hypothetical protein
MKKLTLTLLASLSLSFSASAQFTDLISFGTSGIGVIQNAIGSWNQTTSLVSLNGTATLGDKFDSSEFSSQNWSTSAQLFVKSSFTTDPALPFYLELYSSGGSLGVFEGNTSTSTLDGGFRYLNLTPTGGASIPSLTNVVGLTFSLGGGASGVDISLNSVAVPEPSTYALMAIGGLVLFFIARRRKAQV